MEDTFRAVTTKTPSPRKNRLTHSWKRGYTPLAKKMSEERSPSDTVRIPSFIPLSFPSRLSPPTGRPSSPGQGDGVPFRPPGPAAGSPCPPGNPPPHRPDGAPP